MANGIHRLSALEVKSLSKPGHYSDGGGLYLQVSRFDTKSWVFKYTVHGKTRGMGLGPTHTFSLAEARDKSADLRKVVAEDRDPIEERKLARLKAKTEAESVMTFKTAVEHCLAKKESEFRNPKHRKQWRSTLDTYANPIIGNINVSHISMQDILRVLEPIWMTKTETASRLRGRIEAVLSWATVAGFRKGENPARWAGNLKELLPKPSSMKASKSHPAVSLHDLPVWFSCLKDRNGMAARALEFLTLCASRSGEVRGALWDEIDLEKGLWVIPASRMKMQKEHRIPLTKDAVSLLKRLPRLEDSNHVFPATRGGMLSDMSLSAVMRRMHR